MHQISPIAYFHSPLREKFGVPRQSSIVGSLEGLIVFEPQYAREEALRGLEGFDYLWLIWGFDRNAGSASLTVRPPRLGGNDRIGVFATRSPFRPNALGLSSVRIKSIDFNKCTIAVLGADLADNTPIYDIKPYLPYTDSHPDARAGFTDNAVWTRLDVLPSNNEVKTRLGQALTSSQLEGLMGILREDPRPQYQKKSNPTKSYGLLYLQYNVKFHVKDNTLYIDDLTETCDTSE